MPVLNPDCKHNLLSQSFRVESAQGSSYFGKILVTSRSFVYYARDRNAYRFTMRIMTESVSFYFQCIQNRSRYTEFVELSYQQASAIVKFLKPSFFDVAIYTQDEDTLGFLDLVDLTTGDIAFGSSFHSHAMILQSVLKHWKRIKELSIHARLLMSTQLMPPTHFDELTINGIESLGRLNRSLKHTAKCVTFFMNRGFSMAELPDNDNNAADLLNDVGHVDAIVLEETQRAKPQCVESMYLDFYNLAANNNYQMVVEIAYHAYRNLKSFRIDVCYEETQADMFNNQETETVGIISDNYTGYIQIGNFLKRLDIFTTLEVQVSLSSVIGPYFLPVNWIDNMLETHPGLGNLGCNTEDYGVVVNTKFHDNVEDTNFRSTFDIDLEYRYVEVMEVESDEEMPDEDEEPMDD